MNANSVRTSIVRTLTIRLQSILHQVLWESFNSGSGASMLRSGVELDTSKHYLWELEFG